jgi:hypothetical protein
VKNMAASYMSRGFQLYVTSNGVDAELPILIPSYHSSRFSPRFVSGDTWVARTEDVGYTLSDACRLRVRASGNDVIIARHLFLLHILHPTKR